MTTEAVPPTIKLLATGLAPAKISLGLLSKSNSTTPSALAALDADVAELLPEETVAENSAPAFKSSTSTDNFDLCGAFLFSQVNT